MDSSNAEGQSADVTVVARSTARRHKTNAIESYRQRLLVTESAVQANRLIVHLDKVLQAKGNSGEDVSEALATVEESRKELDQAMRNDSSTVVLDVEGRMEQLTLTYDPLYLENEDERRAQRKQDLDEKAKAGWMTEPSNRFIQFMKGDFKGKKRVTRSERRSCISRAAWIFAISGMAIAIVFLIIDFVTAQTHPVLRTKVIYEETLPLPVMTFCMGFPNIGTFINRERDNIKGESLFGVTSYENFETKQSYSLKEAHAEVFEEVTLGPDYCRDSPKLKGFSVEHQQKNHPHRSKSGQPPRTSSAWANNCYSCFRMNFSSPLELSASKAVSIGRPPIAIKLARHKFVNYCFGEQLVSPYLAEIDALARIIFEHGDELIKLGILKVEEKNLEFALFDFLKAVPQVNFVTLDSAAMAEHIEMTNNLLCSVYFFSGYFYPVNGEKMDIKWVFGHNGTFDTRQRKWRQAGAGPYPKSYYFDDITVSVNRTMVEELKDTELHDDRRQQHVHVYGLDHSITRLPTINDHAVTLADRHAMTLHFTRSIEHGVPSFKTQTSYGSQITAFDLTLFAEYSLEMALASFERQETSRRPATSVAEFLTDVFEYAGLFTGVCAYTILVAPARMYLRRSYEAPNASPFK